MEKVTFDKIIGGNSSLARQVKMAEKAAACDIPVLLVGETGTGKEIFSRAIHNTSHRKDGPFVAENCSAIPISLAEGILFGTEKGAFTEAVSREGRFEEAQRGTFFMDEINAMPIYLQAKMLRVLQENAIRRIGGSKEIPLDIRTIAALNESPEELMDRGLLRMDLYYRLSVFRIDIPPLRERREDISLYIRHFILCANEKYGKSVKGMDEIAERELCRRPYPGNVRELKNVIEGAVAMSIDEEMLHLDSII